MAKFKLDYSNEKHVQLVKAMGSKNKIVAQEANEIFAQLMSFIVQKLLDHAGSASLIYEDFTYNEDDDPSFPLDLFFAADEGEVTVWTQSQAGGLPTSEIRGMSDMKFSPYQLNSAVSFKGVYARKARLDVVSMGVNRMFQEILVKQERNAWFVIMKALGEATTLDPENNTTADHITSATNAGTFVLHDLNVLMTLVRRNNASWNGGTGVDSSGLTDLFVSPEVKENIRAFAYQPLNTTNPAQTAATATHTGIPLDDATRRDIFNSPGVQELYGVAITEILELGTNRKYSKLFDLFSPVAYAPATQQIIPGFDLSRGAFKRPVEADSETGSTFSTEVDDQWAKRTDTIGWFGSLREARIGLDGRAVAGIII